MKFISNIRDRLGRFVLSKKSKHLKRKRKFFGLQTAKRYGIIFYVNKKSHEEIDKVKELIKFLKKNKEVEIKALGFYDQKIIPYKLFESKKIAYFCRKDLNWINQPKTKEVSGFIKEDFDVLIDLSLKPVYPLHYIADLSRARFKIGKLFKNQNGHDFMVNVDQDNTTDYMIKQLKNYLSIIKT